MYENAYESNYAIFYVDCCCLVSRDMIFKSYFDRGIYDMQGCNRAIGVVRGTPYLKAGNVQYVCFCQDCPETCNNLMNMNCPTWCGDRVSVSFAEYIYCCIPTRSNFVYNCCGLYGVKDGEPMPMCLCPFVTSLKVGTADHLVAHLDSARANWMSRTGQR